MKVQKCIHRRKADNEISFESHIFFYYRPLCFAFTEPQSLDYNCSSRTLTQPRYYLSSIIKFLALLKIYELTTIHNVILNPMLHTYFFDHLLHQSEVLFRLTLYSHKPLHLLFCPEYWSFSKSMKAFSLFSA